MGHHNVFAHVGRNVKVRAPNGRDVYPLITGTFGGADFVHSLMGEATDHLSAASVSDLTLRTLFTSMPGGDGEQLTREMDGVSNMRAGQPGGLDPSQMSPQQMHDTLWTILSFRDSVMKKIEMTIDKIPGLSGLVEKISNNVSVFIITTLEPFVKPPTLSCPRTISPLSSTSPPERSLGLLSSTPSTSSSRHGTIPVSTLNL
jgi:hypothetical protein